MKKTLLSFLLLAVAALAFTGCQDEKPYSLYQIGVDVEYVDYQNPNLTASDMDYEQLSKYSVMNYVVSYLINQGYIYTNSLGNPIVIEGADADMNDQNATRLYENKRNALLEVDLDALVIKAIEDGDLRVMQAPASEGTDREIVRGDSFYFTYYITGLPQIIRERITVSY